MASKRTDWQKYYATHAEHERARQSRRREELIEWLAAYKRTQRCKFCGEHHPACLDFHHRDPAQKDMSVSNLVRTAPSLERLWKEIQKCDVLCANCHRRLHWEETHNG